MSSSAWCTIGDFDPIIHLLINVHTVVVAEIVKCKHNIKLIIVIIIIIIVVLVVLWLIFKHSSTLRYNF